MQSAGLETLHTAHVFTELNRGLYSGANKKGKDDGWKDHIVAAEDGQVKTVVNYFQRLEFQDGKRKLPAQDYHVTAADEFMSTAWITCSTWRRLAWSTSSLPRCPAKTNPRCGATCSADLMAAVTAGGVWRTGPPDTIPRSAS